MLNLAFSDVQIEELLQAWPRLRRAPSPDKRVGVIQGWLAFTLKPAGLPEITDTYRLLLKVPLAGSLDVPVVYEEGGRIHRTDDNHVNPRGNLCLGSPWRIRIKCGFPPSLIEFVEQCVVPFLYGASWREQSNTGFPFDVPYTLSHPSPAHIREPYGQAKVVLRARPDPTCVRRKPLLQRKVEWRSRASSLLPIKVHARNPCQQERLHRL